MRKLGLSLLVCGMAVVPYAAMSQEASMSTDDYVCAFTGECPEAAAEEPAADENQATQGGPRVSATRGFSLARPNTPARRPAPKATSTRPTQRQQTASAQRPNRPAANQGRVNLRVSFAMGSDDLTASAQSELRVLAQALQQPQLANMRLRIEGHTDSVGSRELNLDLSKRRAQAVASYLENLGIPSSRLEVQGYGYDRPLPGMRPSAPQNRRVEAVRIS